MSHRKSKPDQNDWERLQQLFDRVCHMSIEERLLFLDRELSTSDVAVRDRLERMLDQQRGVRMPIEHPGALANVYGRIVDQREGSIATLDNSGSNECDQGLRFDQDQGKAQRYVGNYYLIQELGKGGMGVVYLAGHRHLAGRKYAIKILRPGTVDLSAFRRFQKEINVLSTLAHENLVYATDAGIHDGSPYLVMDYVEGADLQVLIRKNGPLQIPEACEIVRLVCLGLQHAHEHHVVHRDVKPPNVLLSVDGKVKILDLGLARLRNDSSPEPITQTGQVLGSLDYMSPEQWRDVSAVGPAADIYGCGCTLYCLLSGKPPFGDGQCSTLQAKMRAHLETPPPPMSSPCGEVPAALNEVVLKSLAKEPQDRFASAAEMSARLLEFCHGSNLSQLCLTGAMGLSNDAVTRLPTLDETEVAPSASVEQQTSRNKWPIVVLLLALVATCCLAAIGRRNELRLSVERLVDLDSGVRENHGPIGELAWDVFINDRARVRLASRQRENIVLAAFVPSAEKDRYIPEPDDMGWDGDALVYPDPSGDDLWVFEDGVGPHVFLVIDCPKGDRKNVIDVLNRAPWDHGYSRTGLIRIDIKPGQDAPPTSPIEKPHQSRGVHSYSNPSVDAFVNYLKENLPDHHMNGLVFPVLPRPE